MYAASWTKKTTTEVPFSNHKMVTAMLISLFDAGWLMVDHVHFQYNGMLLCSVALLRQGRDVAGALVFSLLLMFKHIYLYAALLYFVYLFRHYCCRAEVQSTKQRRRTLSDIDTVDIEAQYNLKSFSLVKFLTLGAVVLVVVFAAVGSVLPLADKEGSLTCMIQILQRLFPVQRGLCHAYWAPNVWALYAFFDKVGYHLLRIVASHRGKPMFAGMTSGSLSKGLVQDAKFALFPSVPTSATLVLTVLFMLPVLRDVWRRPHPAIFNPALVYCMLTSYMLGYHVHEKAILQVVLPMSVMSMESLFDARLYCMLAFTAHVSLLPLLFTTQEIVTRLLLVSTHSILVVCVLHIYLRTSLQKRRIRGDGLRFTRFQKLYFVGLGILAVAISTVHFSIPALVARFPFLPQMMTSVYCAGGMIYCWVTAYSQHKRKLKAIETYCKQLE